jgi:hypothetical protein
MIEKQQYLETNVKPILENIVFHILSDRPENPANYMIDWLQKTGGYTSNGLTLEEKRELEALRKQVIEYRERD